MNTNYGLSDHMFAKVRGCGNKNDLALLLVQEHLAKNMDVAREIIQLARDMNVGVIRYGGD